MRKCPGEKCTHEFDIFDFDGYFKNDAPIVCPVCNSLVVPVLDYYRTRDGDEYPYVSELEVIEPEKNNC